MKRQSRFKNSVLATLMTLGAAAGSSFGPSAGSDKKKPVDLDVRERKRQDRALRLQRQVAARIVQPTRTVQPQALKHEYDTTVSKTTRKGQTSTANKLTHRADCARCAAERARS